MTLKRSIVIVALVAGVFAFVAFAPRNVTAPPSVVFAQPEQEASRCIPVGGMIMTNLAVIGQSTTLGTATGDLRGRSSRHNSECLSRR
jgi:hypothetical protein